MAEPGSVDVVIIGGAFAGAATAILLRREAPALTVLVVERAPAFDLKVGESTTEMAAMFLTRRLGLWGHLEREHLPKEGLRYWSSNEHVTSHLDASETGGTRRAPVPTFQLRRDALDEHMLATAAAEGALLRRPARVREVALGEFDHRVEIEHGGTRETVACRWVVDASGRRAFLGKRLGLIDRNQDHPTGAMWCRFQGLRHLDEIAARSPARFVRHQISSRRLGTNHYLGFGYWVWVIPLGGGETSVGVVYDRRLVALGEATDPRAAFREFLLDIPALVELLEGAVMREDDFRAFAHLPYVTRQYMGRGWALVGDAAAFLDPYYSPGLDHAAFSVEATVDIIAAEHAGADVTSRIARHNATFLRSYHRFFRGVYEGKYYYMGEHDLVSAAYMLDTAHYYYYVVIPAFVRAGRFHWMPVLGPPPAFLSFKLIQLYNRRFKRIALARRAAGEAGARNHGRRLSAFYDLGLWPTRMFLRGLRLWALAELDLLRLHARRLAAGSPAPLPAADSQSAATPRH